MRQVPVYQSEIELGLAEAIGSHNSFSCLSIAKAAEIQDEKKYKQIKLPENTKASNTGQIDLFFIKDILVSCGWNANDDIFLPHEAWAARNTSTDKPFNIAHSATDIIGHITDQFVLNTRGEVIPDDTPIDKIPDSFDILNHTAIYRFYNNAEMEEKISKIITEITTSDKWKVSMEAIFTDYDYGIEDNGETIIIARNSKTAFLSQYLKAYGGKGIYKGKRIGRVLKNIVFCGKGLTDNPANPKSLIVGTQPFTVKADKNNSSVFDLGYINLNEGDVVMNENELKTKLAETETAVANSKVEVAKLASETKEKDGKISELQASLTKSNDNLTSVASKLTESEKNVADTKAALEAKTKELNELTEKYTKAQAELNAIAAEKVKNARIDSMVNELKMTKEAASDLYTSLASLDDTAFASYIEKSKKSLTAKVETPTPTPTPETVVASGTPEKPEATVVADNSGDKNSETASKIKNYIKASKGVSRKEGDK